MKLKIGRYEYEIDERDKFLDNGACVQLLTQSKEVDSWGRPRAFPKLSKALAKKISKYNKIDREHGYSEGCRVFSIIDDGK